MYDSASINTVLTHPNYWPLKVNNFLYQYVGKQYVLANPSNGYTHTWVLSAPYYGNRVITYSFAHPTYLNRVISPPYEWEQWAKADINTIPRASVLQYAGANYRSSFYRYGSVYACTKAPSTYNLPGVDWPELGTSNYNFTRMWSRYPNFTGACTEGYIGVIRDNALLYDDLGNRLPNFCNTLFPLPAPDQPDAYSYARALCNHPGKHLDLVYQVYTDGVNAGVETVIYLSGHALPPANVPYNDPQVGAWFRNGELRYTEYQPIWVRPIPAANDPDAALWWTHYCRAIFDASQAPTYTGKVHAYTGLFKLNERFIQDTLND